MSESPVPEDTPAHLTPKTSDRGFRRLSPIHGVHDGTVRVYESSAATGPHLWLGIGPPGDDDGAVVHLAAERAWQLKEQIEWLLEHHYQGDARPEYAKAVDPLCGCGDQLSALTGARCGNCQAGDAQPEDSR